MKLNDKKLKIRDIINLNVNIWVKRLLMKHIDKIHSVDLFFDSESSEHPHLLNLDDGWICDDSHIHYFGSYNELKSILESAEKESK